MEKLRISLSITYGEKPHYFKGNSWFLRENSRFSSNFLMPLVGNQKRCAQIQKRKMRRAMGLKPKADVDSLRHFAS
jgi:hypothetical protein